MGLLLLHAAEQTLDDLQVFDAGADSSVAAYISRRRGARWTAIARIFLDDGTENVAAGKVNHPSRTYEARVLAWGSIERSIPVPSGMPEAARARLRLGDTDLAWRNKMGSQTPQGRRIQVKFLQAGTSEAAADIIFTGIIEEFRKGPGYLELSAVSDMLAWIDEPIPEVITPANFPEFPNVKQSFLPVILGHVVAGAVPTGYTPGPPEDPPAGAMNDAANAAAALTAEIAAATFTTPGVFSAFQDGQEWINKIESKYAQALALIINEFDLEYDAGVLELADAEYARDKLQELLDATDAKATEFAAGSVGRASIISAFRSGVTSFFGENWETMLTKKDAQIAALGGSPPEELVATQGAIPLPYIGWVEGIGDRWGGAIHALWNPLIVHRKRPDESIFTPVISDEFEVTVQTREFGEYPGRTFDCTFIDFHDQQPEGTEIRLDADGAFYRGEFGAMPAAGYGADDSRLPLDNPVDGFLILRDLLFAKAPAASGFDIDALMTLRAKLEIGGATIPPLSCNEAIIESMTPRELLGRFNASFQTDLFESNRGLLKMVRIDDTNDNRPVLTESVILKDSFEERSPNPTVNRFRANYTRNHAGNTWFDLALADNVEDQTNRGKLEEQTIDLHFVRDPITAQAAISDRLRYTSLGSYLQRLEVPLKKVSHWLELARLFGIMHRHGMQISGYHNREVKVIGTSIDLDGFKVTIDSIVRAPQRFGQVVEMAGTFDAGADSDIAAVETDIRDLIIRPTDFEFNPAPGLSVRGTFTDPEDALTAGDGSFLRCEISGGSGLSTFAIDHYKTWETIPEDLTGLLGVTFRARIRWAKRGPEESPNTTNPYFYIEAWHVIKTNPVLVPSSDPIDGIASVYQNPGDGIDQETFIEVVSDPISAERFNEVKDNLIVRVGQLMEVGDFAAPYPHLDVSEIWAVLHFVTDPFA